MALHPKLPRSPFEPMEPAHRWFPADEALRASSYERLLPPLVARIRAEVHDWRASGYAGASQTSRSLLRFDASGAVSAGMFPEDWPRYVVKMATGAGKTKVLSLLIA